MMMVHSTGFRYRVCVLFSDHQRRTAPVSRLYFVGLAGTCTSAQAWRHVPASPRCQRSQRRETVYHLSILGTEKPTCTLRDQFWYVSWCVDNTQNQECKNLRITLGRVFFMGTRRPPNSHIVYCAFEILVFLVNVLALRVYAAQVDRRQS